ncbi:MAG: hypothetical protein ACO1QS_07130 [Verrucomicrobiota bacterium]
MTAFEVYVNKTKVCTAGIGELDAIISGLVCSINKDGRPDERKISFHVSGAADKAAFNWVQYNLSVGDRVEIRVVDTEKVDTPKKIECKGGSCAA